MYTVKQIADKVGLSEHTVRYYTNENLIPNVMRDKNNNRVFTEESVGWLIGIKCLKDGGVPLKKIKEYVDLCLQGEKTVKERYKIIENELKLKDSEF